MREASRLWMKGSNFHHTDDYLFETEKEREDLVQDEPASGRVHLRMSPPRDEPALGRYLDCIRGAPQRDT